MITYFFIKIYFVLDA